MGGRPEGVGGVIAASCARSSARAKGLVRKGGEIRQRIGLNFRDVGMRMIRARWPWAALPLNKDTNGAREGPGA